MTVADFLTAVSPTTVLVVIFLCLVIHRLLWRDGRNLPPTPGYQLPVIGHMHYMKSDLRQTVRPLRRQLGDIYRLQLGSRMVIVLGGYKTMKEAFVKNAEVFSDRPYIYTLEKVTQNKGFVNKSGFEWKEHRRFVLSTLKDLGMGRRVLETRVLSGAATLVQLFKETGETPFYPRPMVNTIVWNVITSMLFGDTVEHGDPLVSTMLQIIETNLKNAPVAGILNLFPFLRYLPGDLFRLKQCVNNSNKVHAFSNDIVSDHEQRADKTSVDDLTSAYLKVMKEKGENNETTSFTLDNLSGTISDLFIAGSETTTTAISWSIVCMVAFPEVQEKLYSEITTYLGKDKTPSVADRSNLAYVEAFYMEVLRYCNIVPVLVPHAVSRDTQLLGYTIPKDALVFGDLDSVATDPDIWGDPENFRPERFIDSKGHLTKNEEFILFFFGKRSCIGESLARMELFLILVCLVQQFEFVSPENEPLSVEAVDGEIGIIHAPKVYQVVARQRK